MFYKKRICKNCKKEFMAKMPAHSFCGSEKEKTGCSYINFLNYNKKRSKILRLSEKYKIYRETRKEYDRLRGLKRRSRKGYKKERRAEYQKYITFISFHFRKYKQNAKERQLFFTLTEKDFQLMWQAPCFYCKQFIKYIGIDRVDNSKGYIKENCVPCCSICNKMKLTMSKEKFIGHCKLISNNF